MNLSLLAVLYLLIIQTTFANPNQTLNEKRLKQLKELREKKGNIVKKVGFLDKSDFDVIPLNSPVKEGTAKFLLKAPSSFEIQQISYRLHNSTDLLEKNKKYSVTKLIDGPRGKELHVSMSNFPNGFYKLYVKVKTKKDKEKDHDYRSAYSEYVKFIHEKQVGEVPIPDPELNDSTLLGIDTDNDGVRDDLQLRINETYQPSAYPSTNYALKQVSRYYQLFLVNALDKEKAMPYYIKSLESIQCLSWIRKNGYLEHKEFMAHTLNTPERIKAYLKVDSYRIGKGMPESIDRLNTNEFNHLCEFKPSKE